ncbi:LOW QUALITY PROTEIN: hypothetical protein CVT26_012323 [Gymnopilus dilepis]|uniref:Uncharacterized protein n=1 Tax=Gymnopilus dilepis TaxID=231916 RepID=A0A409YCD5_9AGAR|nr:LOW QUALITY PROTEIN: hypothetical protein CVT26_012323 [Gymnopilus dilepis]
MNTSCIVASPSPLNPSKPRINDIPTFWHEEHRLEVITEGYDAEVTAFPREVPVPLYYQPPPTHVLYNTWPFTLEKAKQGRIFDEKIRGQMFQRLKEKLVETQEASRPVGNDGWKKIMKPKSMLAAGLHYHGFMVSDDFRQSGHPDRAGSLSNLAIALQTSFEQSGSQKDLEEAILKQYAALELRSRGHPDHSLSLNNLANALYISFRQSGSPKDLDKFNLATALKTCFNLSDLEQNFNKAVSMYREALKHCPSDHSVNDFGFALSGRFYHFADGRGPQTLSARSNTSPGSLGIPCKPWDMGHGTCLRARARTVNDVEEAITHHREAISPYEGIVLYGQLVEVTTGEAAKQSRALTGWSKALRERFALITTPRT